MFAHELLYLSQSDVIRCGGMSMRAVMADLAHVLALHVAGDYVLPPKVVLRWGDLDSEGERGRINGMPGYVGGRVNIAGMKWVGSAPDKYGLPRASALIVLTVRRAVVMLPLTDFLKGMQNGNT
ncbi:Rossmann-fold NAD(P)-binding domain-containing protein [Numidum massiliense]|uniref:hypothetical protein n=1 Tax=Numidum massiliense TaxID=1522315 RepID=UPI0006D58AE0|nr:hypothetical protein [Numidum massiliense]